MLKAISTRIFNQHFAVYEGGKELATLDLSYFGEKARLGLKQGDYEVRRTSMYPLCYGLYIGSEQIAGARGKMIFSRSFEVTYLDRSMHFMTSAIMLRNFELLENDSRIGMIVLEGWIRLSSTIDLPDELPLPLQMFLFCIAAFMWRNSS